MKAVKVLLFAVVVILASVLVALLARNYTINLLKTGVLSIGSSENADTGLLPEKTDTDATAEEKNDKVDEKSETDINSVFLGYIFICFSNSLTSIGVNPLNNLFIF